MTATVSSDVGSWYYVLGYDPSKVVIEAVLSWAVAIILALVVSTGRVAEYSVTSLLKDGEEGNVKLFIYDKSKKKFTPFNEAKANSINLLILDNPEEPVGTFSTIPDFLTIV